MKFSPAVFNVFKPYDIRGLVPEEMTPELARAVGRALADFLPGTAPIAVGRDMRNDSEILARAVMDGVTEQGRQVWDLGLIATDMLYFAVGNWGLAGGAVVTASHNPGKYNGIKLCGEMASPIGVETGLWQIKKAIEQESYQVAPKPGRKLAKNILTEWVDHALGFIDVSKIKPLCIAIDAGNGMAGLVLPEVAKRLPLKVTEMYYELDGDFPNHPANPLDPKNLQELMAQIRTGKLDLGIAFDGDGDRAFLVDQMGQTVSGSILAAMLADYHLRKEPGGTILYNAICSRIVPETVESAGGKSVRTRVGHSYIKAEMKRHDAIFAGEHSGHYYFKENFGADSGLIAALIALEIISEWDRPLSVIAGGYKRYHNSGEINSEVSDVAKKLDEVASNYLDGEQDHLDGLTVNYGDWWFNIRPSNTEPLLRLNVEAKSERILKQKTKELLELIRA